MASRLLLRNLTRSVLLARPIKTFRPNVLPPSLISTIPQLRRFTLTRPCFTNGEVDSELVHQLEEELQFEQDDEKNEVPAFVKEFLDANLFKIEDQLGHDKVKLTRTFGSEKINVIFSISDINNTAEHFSQEEEILDTELHQQQQQEEKKIVSEVNTTTTTTTTTAATAKEEEEKEEATSFPVRATVVVEKTGKGSLVLNTVAQDGYLHIDAVRYFKEGQLITDDITTAGEQRQDLYLGPVYEELDEDLQLTFSKYLEERGIDTALATFLPDYVDYKEQKEYVNWLKDVNEFVST